MTPHDAPSATTRPTPLPPASARPPRLVLVVGPVASGKSTLATLVADRLRTAGEAVAVVPLDTVAEMALPTLPDWAWAHEIHCRLVGAWLATPLTTVIAEGLETPAEIAQLREQIPADTDVVTVLLTADYAAALARAQADPTRGLSRDPEFLARMYRRFERGVADIPRDLQLDTESAPAPDLADRVVALLTARGQEQSRPDAGPELS